ncbi:hypothetical protein [Mumia flava]|uniref:hypothetical protein n=1 Tax=Mumia flava TaxID=1348852 RepID=UPI001FE63955|nr:hypothetical protein [Mumia flava]
MKKKAFDAARYGVETWVRIGASILSAFCVMAFGVIWWIGPEIPEWGPFGPHLPFEGWATGTSMILSSLIALTLIVYSVRRFRGEALDDAEVLDDAEAFEDADALEHGDPPRTGDLLDGDEGGVSSGGGPSGPEHRDQHVDGREAADRVGHPDGSLVVPALRDERQHGDDDRHDELDGDLGVVDLEVVHLADADHEEAGEQGGRGGVRDTLGDRDRGAQPAEPGSHHERP